MLKMALILAGRAVTAPGRALAEVVKHQLHTLHPVLLGHLHIKEQASKDHAHDPQGLQFRNNNPALSPTREGEVARDLIQRCLWYI